MGSWSGNALYKAFGNAFPAGYREDFAARAAVPDIEMMDGLSAAAPLAMSLYRPLEVPPGVMRFKLFHLGGPVPLKKVDPKYPPSLISERVEGEVILYAVIRRDGSVDSTQIVKGIDEQLDANSMSALAQWKFRPATKQGEPVELEAIVHIPFRLRSAQ